MKIRADAPIKTLPSNLIRTLINIRQYRNFNTREILDLKAKKINAYLADNGLSACVIAVSGGIDSAVVLGILSHAKDQPKSPIKKIIAATLPLYNEVGVTGQKSAALRAHEVCAHFSQPCYEIDLAPAHRLLTNPIDHSLGIIGSPWATGQVASYIRTPALYYITSLLTENKMPAVVIGTTNRDEGAYLGYFGKASDGMVDIQLVSDLHKSEIRALAAYLNVPYSVQAVAPTGDMFDGTVDEDVFGATYDMVELHHAMRAAPPAIQALWQKDWTGEDQKIYTKICEKLDALHKYNAHKYKVGSPAIHLDILDSHVPGGWYHRTSRISITPSRIHGAFDFDDSLIFSASTPTTEQTLHLDQTLDLVKNLLSIHEQKDLLDKIPQTAWVPATVNGFAHLFNSHTDQIGSYRASAFCKSLSEQLWARLKPCIQSFETLADMSVWRAIGINPLFRFIKYPTIGALLAHYDAPVIFDKDLQTIKSLVIYLKNDDSTSGGTRFYHDALYNTKHAFKDWTIAGKDADIALSFKAIPGNALIFPHRLLHDSASTKSSEKIILRTDIIYERII